MPHACCSLILLVPREPQAEAAQAAEVPFPCTASFCHQPDLHGRHSPEKLHLLWWTGCPPTPAPWDSLCLPPEASGVALTSLKSTFTRHRQWKTAPGRAKAVTIHESTEHREQRTQEHLPGHLNSCISAPLCGQTQDQPWCLMSYQALHGFKGNPVPRKADNGLHTDTTLPFNDFLKVSIISFQAPLNSGCLFFAHHLLMVA